MTVEELIEKINRNYEANIASSRQLSIIQHKIEQGIANWEDAHLNAAEIGRILSRVLRYNLNGYDFPADLDIDDLSIKLFPPMLRKAFNEANKTSTNVQELWNIYNGIGIKVQQPIFDELSAANLAHTWVNTIRGNHPQGAADRFLYNAIPNHVQKSVDSFIEVNMDFQAEAGIKQYIRRTMNETEASCTWCESLEGEFEYPNGTPADFYSRHENCNCVIEPVNFSGRRAWSGTNRKKVAGMEYRDGHWYSKLGVRR